MSFATLLRRPWLPPAAALVALGAAHGIGGLPSLAGMALGLGAAGFGVTGLWLLAGLLGQAVARGSRPGIGTLLTILAFLAKIPVYGVLGSAAQRIGDLAMPSFVTGILLVYFAFVAWAVAR